MKTNKCTCSYICPLLSMPTCFSRLLRPSSCVQYNVWSTIKKVVNVESPPIVSISKDVTKYLCSWCNHDKIWIKWLSRKISLLGQELKHFIVAFTMLKNWRIFVIHKFFLFFFKHFTVHSEDGRRRRPKHLGVDNKRHITASAFVSLYTWMKPS